MNPDLVHSRDVSYILDKLQEDMEKVKEKLEKYPEQKDKYNKELQNLIALADRDLKLKTQAIVRSRLSQSKILPLHYVKPANIEIRANTSLTEPLPPLQPLDAPKSPKKTAKFENTIQSLAPQPIGPIGKPEQRVTTVSTAYRQRRIPDNITRLPRRDFHDPAAPAPEIDPSIIPKYGLLQLEDVGLVDNRTVKSELSSLISVAPFKYDFAQKALDMKQNYVMDEDAVNAKPNEIKSPRSIDPQPVDYEPIPLFKQQPHNPSHAVLQFVNGEPLTSTIDYITFKKQYSNVWEQIEVIFQMLKRLCEIHNLAAVRVDSHAVLDLCQFDPDEIQDDRLLLCFIDMPLGKSRKKSTKVGLGFVGPYAEQRAATVIQALWRGFYARRKVRQIRRNGAAVRIIQRWWRTIMVVVKFRSSYITEQKRRLHVYETLHSDPANYQPEKPHVIVELVGGNSSAEYGRMIFSRERQTVLILYSKEQLPSIAVTQIKSKFVTTSSVYALCAQQKLPKSMPIEDVLACDSRSLTRIKKIAGTLPIYLLPTQTHKSLVEISAKINCLILAPSPLKASIFETREATRRLFETAGNLNFPGSEPVYDRLSLCTALATNSIKNLDIVGWNIRCNNDEIAWMSTNDMSLLEKLRNNKNILTKEDLEDPSFTELLSQNFSNELNNLLNTKNFLDVKDFLSSVWVHGATVEEAPRMPKSSPAVMLFVPPCGKPVVEATWERLFISAHEEFAKIYPAFSIDQREFARNIDGVGRELSSRLIYGHSTINYWVSLRDGEKGTELSLIADSIKVNSYSANLSSKLVQIKTDTTFNPETFKFDDNIFIYYQEVLKIPKAISAEDLMTRLSILDLPAGDKIIFVDSITDRFSLGLIVVEKSIEKVITLVYKTLCALVEEIFRVNEDPGNILYTYIQSIDFIKNQIDLTRHISSTVMMRKIKYRDSGAIVVEEKKEDEEKKHEEEEEKQQQIEASPELANFIEDEQEVGSPLPSGRSDDPEEFTEGHAEAQNNEPLNDISLGGDSTDDVIGHAVKMTMSAISQVPPVNTPESGVRPIIEADSETPQAESQEEQSETATNEE